MRSRHGRRQDTRWARLVAAGAVVALLAGSCTDGGQETTAGPSASPSVPPAQPSTATAEADGPTVPVTARLDGPAARAATVTLGTSQVAAVSDGASSQATVGGTPDTAGAVVAADADGTPVGLAVAVKAEWADPDVVVDTRSTVKTLALLTPGFATPDPALAWLLLAGMEETDELDQAEQLLAELQAADPAVLTDPPPALLDAAAAAASAGLDAATGWFETGQAIGYVGRQDPGLVGPSCDQLTVVTAAALEQDNVCFTADRVDGGQVILSATNRSPRWVAVYLGPSTRQPLTLIPPAGLRDFGPSTVLAYGRLVHTMRFDTPVSTFADLLPDQLNVRIDQVAHLMDRLQEVADGLTETHTMQLQIPLVDSTTGEAIPAFETTTFGFPTEDTCRWFKTDPIRQRRVLDAAVLTSSTEVALPALLVLFDNALGLADSARLSARTARRAGTAGALADRLAGLTGSQLADATTFAAGQAAGDVGADDWQTFRDVPIRLLHDQAQALVDRQMSLLQPAYEDLCQAGRQGSQARVAEVMASEASGLAALLRAEASDRQYLAWVVGYQLLDLLAASLGPQVLLSILDDPAGQAEDLLFELASAHPLGGLVSAARDTAGVAAGYIALLEDAWRFDVWSGYQLPDPPLTAFPPVPPVPVDPSWGWQTVNRPGIQLQVPPGLVQSELEPQGELQLRSGDNPSAGSIVAIYLSGPAKASTEHDLATWLDLMDGTYRPVDRPDGLPAARSVDRDNAYMVIATSRGLVSVLVVDLGLSEEQTTALVDSVRLDVDGLDPGFFAGECPIPDVDTYCGDV